MNDGPFSNGHGGSLALGGFVIGTGRHRLFDLSAGLNSLRAANLTVGIFDLEFVPVNGLDAH